MQKIITAGISIDISMNELLIVECFPQNIVSSIFGRNEPMKRRNEMFFSPFTDVSENGVPVLDIFLKISEAIKAQAANTRPVPRRLAISSFFSEKVEWYRESPRPRAAPARHRRPRIAIRTDIAVLFSFIFDIAVFFFIADVSL